MKTIKAIFFIFTISSLIFSCSTEDKKNDTQSGSNEVSERVLKQSFNPDSIMKVDLNQDLSGKSLQELRLLRNVLYARQGYCFMQADIRGYFSGHMKGYDSIMEARFWSEEGADSTHTFPPIKLSPEEAVFVKKIETLEAEKKKNNYVDRNGGQLGNVENIVNLFQFTNLSTDFISMLDKNNFAIVPTNKIQLFHIYEENDYNQVPNFITTDLYLQLYHMYFSYVLKSLEESKFIPVITELSEGMYMEAVKVAASSKDERIKSTAEYTATFYAIPYYILTGKKKSVPAKYKEMFEAEISHINSETDAPSEFLEYKQAFSYSLFKPRGHYTRNEELKKYFKVMMWLQTASFCRETPEQLNRTIFMAQLLNTGKSTGNQLLMKLYNSVYEPIIFLIGEPDNLSVNDIVSFFKKNNVNDLSAAMKPDMQTKVDAELKAIVKNRNKIKPKIEITCPDKINFMPQRYLFDNEILQELVDIKPNAKRAYPKGLDVFAALGNKSAENILINEYKEKDNWKDYPGELKKLQKKFGNYPDWNKTVYNKWMSSLNTLQKRESNFPAFMKTDMWDRKNLNTSLASWTDLKHDAILYGEQPEAAECGGGGPPSPYTVGYVEPNVNFWKSMIELLALTEDVLKRNGLLTKDIDSKTQQLKESAQFLLSASEKELKKQKLSEQEYHTIEALGASTEYLTLSIIEPDKYLQYWENVQGPDKSVAVVADVYTRNINGCEKDGILHEGVGNVNEIYVVVEIDGYLYLTKGATFSYYEFVQPLGTRLTDEEWQKILETKKDLPTIPQWMKDIILPAKDVPAVDEKIFYSSGC
ncbi:MAG: hypothetical protein A3F72_12845 [Bacteroidetes bacterium RIFCSPLOWO2_12_FULL_35_15]|nr:MAG: hypothetical protein A3F72_12845 [Bacteroidetes bacterium RIFCSPLOWO2_12_FULL_35_15]